VRKERLPTSGWRTASFSSSASTSSSTGRGSRASRSSVTKGRSVPSQDIKSRFYDNTGNTLDYVYELEGDTLTIWGGERGSPAYFKGAFSDDGDTVSGGWVYPDDGGYESTMTRVTSE
jgi:hypothetical protein